MKLLTGTAGNLVLVIVLLGLQPLVAAANDCAKARQYYALGTKLLNYRERRAAFQKAVDLCPSYAEAHNNLADALENLAWLAERTVADEKGTDRQSLRAKRAAINNLQQAAIREYTKALKYRQDMYPAYLGLAGIYFMQGLYGMARETLKKALDMRPGEYRAMEKLKAVERTIAHNSAREDAGHKKQLVAAVDIVKQVKTSPLSRQMSVMGPEEFTVVKERLRFTNIIFDGWSAQINRKEAVQQLDEIGKALASPDFHAYRFLVEGHANTVGMDLPNGEERLTKLSEERAEAVANYLAVKFNIPEDRVIPQGYGCSRLRFPDDSPEHREKNRRVEVVFIRPSEEVSR